jgi:hypothetical protein
MIAALTLAALFTVEGDLGFGPTGALYAGIGGGDLGVIGDVGIRGGLRMAFNKSFGASALFGYERELGAPGGHHVLTFTTRGELLKRMGNEGVVFVDWAAYVHTSLLLSLDDDLAPGGGLGFRVGLGFSSVVKFPVMLEVSFQREWLSSIFSAGIVHLGVAF